MSESKLAETKIIKLGLIRVETTGLLDVIYVEHNNLRVVSLRCGRAGSVRVRIAAQFYSYDEDAWDDVLNTYLAWKRPQLPQFKLPPHSGRKKDGSRHPFRTFHQPGAKTRRWPGKNQPRPRHDTEHEEPAEPPPKPEMAD